MNKLFLSIFILLSINALVDFTRWFGNMIQNHEKPRVSVITSIWKGDKFIEGFLEDMIHQTIFPESELILINPNSPGNEEEVIKKYAAQYPNIRYIRLEKDPGLYAVWNRAIKLASSDIISNANLDDRSRADALELQVKALEGDPTIDLVYTGYYITDKPNETFENNTHRYFVEPPEFCLEDTWHCLAGPRPVWRKSLHDRYGYFDETMSSSADWAMWVRAASLGSKFKKISEFTTLYYLNPEGVSTDQEAHRTRLRTLENALIESRYGHLWKR